MPSPNPQRELIVLLDEQLDALQRNASVVQASPTSEHMTAGTTASVNSSTNSANKSRPTL